MRILSTFIVAMATLAVSSICTPAFCQPPAANRSVIAGLPPCNMDSFVHQAGARAEDIYGDEGVHSKPPINGYTKKHRINAGITGVDDAGLTTGHGSYMPDAVGADEYLQGPNGEWDLSGAHSYSAPIYDTSDNVTADTTRVKGLPKKNSPAWNYASPINNSNGLPPAVPNAVTTPGFSMPADIFTLPGLTGLSGF